MTPDERTVLRNDIKSELRKGFFNATFVVLILFALSFALRAIGVGSTQRALPGHTAAQIDTMRMVQDTVRRVQRENSAYIVSELRAIRTLLEAKK